MDLNGFSLSFVELFSGIGGFRVALEALGCTCVWSCEIDRNARLAYAANFGQEPYHDVVKADYSKIPGFDILTAGFPCQDFSTLGNQDGLDGSNGTLFFEVEKFLQHFQPEYFILENVKGLTTMKNGAVFQLVLNRLRRCGYSVHSQLLNSNLVLPQFRNRVYIVGSRGTSLEELDLSVGLGEYKKRSLFQFLQTGQENPFLDYYKISSEKWKNVKRSKFVRQHGNEGLLRRFICPDDDCIDTLISNYRNSLKNTAQFVSKYERKMLRERLLQNQAKVSSVDIRPRWLTPRELARFMGFPRSFVLHPNEILCSQQFGNAVTPPIVLWVALVFLLYCRGRKKMDPEQISSCLAVLDAYCGGIFDGKVV